MPCLRAEVADVKIDKVVQVVPPQAQRRQVDRDDVEAVKEILAEPALAHFLLQIAIGAGDEAHVDADGLVAADALEFAFLQHAQELDLKAQRNFRDFVEQQRAAVRRLESALAPGDRAR